MPMCAASVPRDVRVASMSGANFPFASSTGELALYRLFLANGIRAVLTAGLPIRSTCLKAPVDLNPPVLVLGVWVRREVTNCTPRELLVEAPRIMSIGKLKAMPRTLYPAKELRPREKTVASGDPACTEAMKRWKAGMSKKKGSLTSPAKNLIWPVGSV